MYSERLDFFFNLSKLLLSVARKNKLGSGVSDSEERRGKVRCKWGRDEKA